MQQHNDAPTVAQPPVGVRGSSIKGNHETPGHVPNPAGARDDVDAVIQAWAEHLRVERSASSNTISNYLRDARRWRTWLIDHGVRELSQVTTVMVEQFVVDLKTGDPDRGRKPLATSSANRALVVVRQLHDFAVKDRILGENVALAVHPVHLNKHYPDTLSVEQACRIIDDIPTGADASAIDLRDRALLELLYGTGARITEILSLKASAGISDSDLLRLFGKGDRERVVPLGQPARDAVEAYVRRGRPELAAARNRAQTRGAHRPGPAPQELFLNTLGRKLSRQSAWGIIKDRAARAGVDAEISPHTFRHSYATHLVQRGVPVRTVQELLGHAAVTTTQLYMHMNAEGIADKWRSAHPRAVHGSPPSRSQLRQ